MRGMITNGLDTDYTVALHYQACHLSLEMHLATTLKNGVTHGLNDTGQLIGTDMGVGIG